MVLAVLVFGSALLAGIALTYGVKSYAERRGVLDHPNERSLHGAPIPRGGGVSIVTVTLVAQAVLVAAGVLPPVSGAVWLGCGLSIAAIGWIDDHVDLPARVRLIAHVLVATAFVLAALGARVITGSPGVALGVLAAALVVLAVVWLVNLYNFMDGIDGFAATEGLLVTACGALIALDAGALAVAVIAAAMAGGCAGFLWWNWQPARIFMGDVGSCFLGFELGALAVHGGTGGVSPWIWAILLAPFVTDATLTLARRMIARETWYRAHRTHAYQLLVGRGSSHARVTLALAALTVVVLWPFAWVAHAMPILAPAVTLMAYLLTGMIWVAVQLRSRRTERADR